MSLGVHSGSSGSLPSSSADDALVNCDQAKEEICNYIGNEHEDCTKKRGMMRRTKVYSTCKEIEGILPHNTFVNNVKQKYDNGVGLGGGKRRRRKSRKSRRKRRKSRKSRRKRRKSKKRTSRKRSRRRRR